MDDGIAGLIEAVMLVIFVRAESSWPIDAP
jgi:hypothetical protein